MVPKKKLLFINSIIYLLSYLKPTLQACIRKPQGATGDNSPVDDSFRITIDGNPATYIPGQVYNVTLSCDIAFKFISFTLVAEPEPDMAYGLDMAGHFDIIDQAETRFSNLCENMIESSNTNIKHRADVAWVAPTNPNSTCIYLKAAVLQHRNVWFIDDGFLTKRICPEEIDDVNSQTPLVNPCCACDEAKYELKVERRWTRNTHAKDFPQDDWRTRFSELIGASHTYDYRFWAYGSRASRGLKELAEHGATTTLEDEIKQQSETGSIRTIIKAPGISFRKNVMTSTLATVRVDPRHHMVSFVTKIIPSPDWILGVAGLELCLANCTWIDEKILNLFPWDIGTDSGPSYMSPDQQQIPADVVRRISSTFPSDLRSPFYHETGAPMKPMATLYMTRKKLYERECEEDDNVPLECATHPWVDWTECSTKCGPGTQYRVRSYKDLGLASRYNCKVMLRQTQRCVGTQCGLPEDDGGSYGQQNAECELTNWSNWGPCSKSCGRGFTKRTRDYKNPYARENCQAGVLVPLEQTKECSGDNCGGNIGGDIYGIDKSGFDEYSREPGLMEEDNININYDRRNQYSRPTRPNRLHEKWNTDERYQNKPNTFGDINQNGFGANNRDNDRQGANFGFGIDRKTKNNNDNLYNYYPSRNFDEESFTYKNKPNNFGFTNNDGDVFNTNSNKNEFWQGNSYNKVDNRSSHNTMFNSFNHNNANDVGFSNKQDPYNNFNNYDEMPPPAYNHKLLNEQVTKKFQSPGFYPVKTPNQQNVRKIEYREYCVEKPFVVRKTCPGKKIISNYWFFDADDNECKIFTTDNCDENKNKFKSLEACEEKCLRTEFNLEEQQFQEMPENQNGWGVQFGEIQSQIRPKKTYGRHQQNDNQFNQPRQRNRNNFSQGRV